ncbi:MAG: site-2 protease family protein [Cyanobacteriota bacterium]|nr:site-2 protease family protein [Cyanobacteriota bacterium]
MGQGWELLRIRGISLRLHPTWFLVLVLLTFVFAREYQHSLGPQAGAPLVWSIALASALLLFLSVVLHEFGHSFVALSQGVKVRSITLFFLGGVANTESECRTARGEFLMAAAGPAVSLVLGGGLLLLRHSATHLSPVLGEMTERLGALNLMLAVFNLLPGLPLDGGRILKAIVWQLTGSQLRGVQVANALGRLLSLLALGLGVSLTWHGYNEGLWLLLLGWMGLGASRSQQQLLLLQRLLTEMRVQEVTKRRFRVLEADERLRAVSRLRLGHQAPSSRSASASASGSAANTSAAEAGPADWLLVCDRGRWLGVIDDQPLRELPVQRWDQDRVRDHLRPLSSLPSIAESAPLWQAVLGLEQGENARLLVLSAAGLPCGTVDRPDLGEAVLARLGVRVPEPFLAKARQQNTYPLGLALGSVARAVAEAAEAAPPVPAPGKPGTS